jgi:alpha-glucosidase (family GH31 glycosyl hydrolase)
MKKYACRQFMLGSALLVTPVLEQSAHSVEGYFPTGRWYDMWDRSVQPIDAG